MAMATMRRWEIFAILCHDGRPHACRDRRHVSAGPEGRRASPAAITGSEFRSQSKISFIPGYFLSSADLVSVLLCVMQEWLQSASGNTQRQTRDSSGWLAGRTLATGGRCEREDGVGSNIPTASVGRVPAPTHRPGRRTSSRPFRLRPGMARPLLPVRPGGMAAAHAVRAGRGRDGGERRWTPSHVSVPATSGRCCSHGSMKSSRSSASAVANRCGSSRS